MKLIQDDAMLLSYVNMQLRDRYDSLERLCEDLNIEKEVLIDRLAKAGYEYREDIRQFR